MIMEYTRQQLIDSLPKGCEVLGLSDLPAALESGPRVYGYVTGPDFPGTHVTSLPTMGIYERRLAAGWTFHLFYRGATRARV